MCLQIDKDNWTETRKVIEVMNRQFLKEMQMVDECVTLFFLNY